MPVKSAATFKLDTKPFDGFLNGLKAAAVGRRGIAALALKEVADGYVLPKVRERTDVKTGKTRRSWRRGRLVATGRRPYLQIVNRNPPAIWLEYGTLGRRRKKLSKRTISRRRQKAAKGTRVDYASKGGIQPRRMLGKTLREVRAKALLALAMQKQMKKSVLVLKYKAERLRV